MPNTDLSEIIKTVKQPSFDNDMIMRLVQGLNEISTKYYNYIQSQNQITENSGDIDREEEQKLWAKREPSYNQKNVFIHMGSPEDIDYVISRLYVNCSKKDLMKIAQLFTDKCAEQNLPNYFKYSSNESVRADQIVIYSNLANLSEYIHILQEIGNENPDILQRCGKPPILTGSIDDWIGIGDEPSVSGTSYTEIRANTIKEVLERCVPHIEEEEGFTTYITDEIDYDNVREELRKAFEQIGINIDTFAFNNDNLQLYMLDRQGIQECDAKKRQEMIAHKSEIEQKKKTQKSYLEEQISIQELKILKQMGIMPEAIDTMISATSSRYGLLTDLARKRADISTAIQKKFELPANYTVTDDFKIQFRGVNGFSEISNEDKQRIIPMIQDDIINYYTNFFNEEQVILNDTLRRYSELEKMPRGENEEIDIERADLYSKLILLSQGKAFFEAIGISTEQTEMVCDKAQDFLTTLENEREEAEKPERDAWKSKIDREFLDAVFRDTGITDPTELRKLYERQDNIRVSEEDLEAVLASFSDSENISPSQIGEATVRNGTGISDINQTTQVMRKSLEQDKDKGNELSN